MNKKSSQKNQLAPAWHKDTKWICGIFLFLLLAPTLLALNLTLITAEKPATEISATLIASAFSRKGLDDETEVKQMRQQVLKFGNVQPIPGLKIFITKEDTEGASPRQLRINFFKKITVLLYREGIYELLQLTTDPTMKKNIWKWMPLFSYFTEFTHEWFVKWFLGLATATLFLLALFIYFSKGFGRLTNPAIIFIIINLPWSLFYLISANNAKNPAAVPVGADDPTGILKYAISNVLPIVSPIINSVNGTLFIAGVGLLLTTILGKIILRLIRH